MQEVAHDDPTADPCVAPPMAAGTAATWGDDTEADAMSPASVAAFSVPPSEAPLEFAAAGADLTAQPPDLHRRLLSTSSSLSTGRTETTFVSKRTVVMAIVCCAAEGAPLSSAAGADLRHGHGRPS